MRMFLIAVGIVFALFSVAITVVVLNGEAPTFADRTGGSAWRNVVFDFQTLLTGVLAVLAAFITVTVMVDTERKQAERHDQLMEISNRRDRLLIARAVDPKVSEGRKLLNSIRNLKTEFELTNEPFIDAVRANPALHYEQTKKIQDFINGDALAQAQPLYDGETNSLYEKLVELGNIIVKSPILHGFAVKPMPGDSHDDFEMAERKKQTDIDDHIISNAKSRFSAFQEMEIVMTDFLEKLAGLSQIKKT